MPKVDELDFKSGESVAPEAGQPGKTEKEETTEETKVETKDETTEGTEDVETLKERLRKAEEEKENYRKGMLSAKKGIKNLTLEKKEDETEDEIEYPEWDENSKKFQEQTLSQAEKKAEERAKSIVEKYNEKTAIAQFVAKNPELAEESNWNELIANYTPRSGKETPQDIVNDLEEALVVTNYRSGKLNDIETKAEEKGKKQGKAEAQIADLSSVSKTTSKTVKEGNALTKSEIEMANRMRVDLKKLAEEDLSIPAETKF